MPHRDVLSGESLKIFLIAGVKDITGQYDSAFYITGAGTTLASVLFFCMEVTHRNTHISKQLQADSRA